MHGFQPRSSRKTGHPSTAARQGKADGGPIRGPGTGTSDSIEAEVPEGSYIMPADSTAQIGEDGLAEMGERGFAPRGGQDGVDVRLSDGEYQLPPEQVHAIGVQALDSIKDATHVPVGEARGFTPGGAEPPVFFADGGEVKRVGNSYSGGNVSGPVAINGSAPRGTVNVADAPPAAPARVAAEPEVVSVRMVPSGGAQAQPTAAPGAAGFRPRGYADGGAVDDPRARGIRYEEQQPGLGTLMRNAAAATPPAAPAQTNPLAQTQGAAFGVVRRQPTAGTRGGMMQPYVATGPSTFEPARVQDGNGRLNAFNDPRSTLYQGGSSTGAAPTARGFAGVGEGWGSGAQKAAAQTPVPPTTTQAAPAAPVAATTAAPAAAAPAVAAQDVASASAAKGILPGVFKQGNSYSDSPSGTTAGFTPRSSSAAPVAAAAPPASPGLGFQPGGLTVIGNPGPTEAQAMFDQADLRTAAARGSWSPRRGFQGDQGAVAAAAIPVQNRQQIELEAGRQAADLQRASLGFQSAAQREAAAARSQTERIAAEDRRAGETNTIRREEVAGANRLRDTQVAQAQDEAALRRVVLDPKSTASDRAKAQQALLAVQGKVAPNEWAVQVTPATKNADGSSTEGSIYRYNRQTGDVQRVDGQGQGVSRSAPPGTAVQALKADPKRAAEFDAKYGVGAAQRALAQS